MTRNMFMEAIKTEQRRIQRLIDLSQTSSTGRGNLYLQEQWNRVYAFERWQKKGERERRVYLGPLESDAVRELFAAKLKSQRLVRLRNDQKLLERIERQYQMYDFDSIVSDMPRAYRAAASANSFDQRYEEIRKWAEAPYPKNPFPLPNAENKAKDGTVLRSKGECIWYNLMQERGILFRYDCEIEIIDQHGNAKKLYPDFLILCFDGTLILIEHLGRMGDLSYAMGFGEKSYWYLQKGFVLGKNYFVTSDDIGYGTDSHAIVRHVDRIEEMFYGF